MSSTTSLVVDTCAFTPPSLHLCGGERCAGLPCTLMPTLRPVPHSGLPVLATLVRIVFGCPEQVLQGVTKGHCNLGGKDVERCLQVDSAPNEGVSNVCSRRVLRICSRGGRKLELPLHDSIIIPPAWRLDCVRAATDPGPHRTQAVACARNMHPDVPPSAIPQAPRAIVRPCRLITQSWLARPLHACTAPMRHRLCSMQAANAPDAATAGRPT